MLALVAATAAAVWAFFRFHQGDPSEWRENYLAELERRQDGEHRIAALTVALDNERSQKDVTPLFTALIERMQKMEDRMSKRMDAFETNQQETAKILANASATMTTLVDAVMGITLVQGSGKRAA